MGEVTSSDVKALRATSTSAPTTLRSTVLIALSPSPLRDGIVSMLRRAMVPYEIEQTESPAAVVVCEDCELTTLLPNQSVLCFTLGTKPAMDCERMTQLSPLASTDDVWAAMLAMPAFAELIPPQLPELSSREVEILGQVCLGHSNDEIARLCYVSTATVKTHLMRIFRKLGVNDRAGAVYVGMSRGIVDGE